MPEELNQIDWRSLDVPNIPAWIQELTAVDTQERRKAGLNLIEDEHQFLGVLPAVQVSLYPVLFSWAERKLAAPPPSDNQDHITAIEDKLITFVEDRVSSIS